VIPVAHAYDQYASEVVQQFHNAGFYVEANLSSETLKKKILEAQVAQWNYILGTPLLSRAQLMKSRWTSGIRRSICQCEDSR
jgi:hypothetical protein